MPCVARGSLANVIEIKGIKMTSLLTEVKPTYVKIGRKNLDG